MTVTTTLTAAEAITARSAQNGGGTFTASGQPVTSGIAVTAEVVEKVEYLTPEAVDTALDQVLGGESLGTWFDEENGVWEISRTWVFAAGLRDRALATAAEWGERYVYDLDADECIAVS